MANVEPAGTFRLMSLRTAWAAPLDLVAAEEGEEPAGMPALPVLLGLAPLPARFVGYVNVRLRNSISPAIGVCGRNFGGAVVDLRSGAQDVVKAAGGGGAALEDIGYPAQSDHRPDENAEIGVERDQGAERNFAAEELMAALPENDQERRADEGLERGHEHAPGADQLDVARNVFAVGLVEAADFGFFLGIGANDADAGKILLHFRGERSERSLNFFVELVDDLAEVADGNEDDRDRQENPERQRTRKLRQDQQGEDHGGQRLAGVHDAGAENHADVVEIVCGARHQFAGAVADVKLRLHQQQAIEEVAANVEFDVARDADKDPSRRERKSAFEQNTYQKDQDNRCRARDGCVERKRESSDSATSRKANVLANWIQTAGRCRR